MGRSWADSRARECNRMSDVEDWPAEWDRSCTGSLWIGAARLAAPERAELFDLAMRAAEERWHELTLARTHADDRDSVLDRAWRASVQFERRRAQH